MGFPEFIFDLCLFMRHDTFFSLLWAQKCGELLLWLSSVCVPGLFRSFLKKYRYS